MKIIRTSEQLRAEIIAQLQIPRHLRLDTHLTYFNTNNFRRSTVQVPIFIHDLYKYLLLLNNEHQFESQEMIILYNAMAMILSEYCVQPQDTDELVNRAEIIAWRVLSLPDSLTNEFA